MDMTASIKRAPRWAWYGAAGIGLGAAGIKLWKDRATDNGTPDASAVPNEDYTGGYAGPGVGGSPVGVIVPPVITNTPTGDPMAGVGELQGLYVGAMGDVLAGWESLLGPLSSTVQQLALDARPAALAAIAQAGSAPQSYAQNPTPVIVVQPSPQATPQPVAQAQPTLPAGPGYKVEHDKRTRDNGKGGAARRVWCVDVTIHRYPDGRAVVVSEDKTKDGAC